jgi:UDP-2-acetamido-3-amino-2,3-dideoxy-glucuronate N-acetyltransferase
LTSGSTIVTIVNNVKVQNNISIYDAVHIKDDVFCGPSMVFTNVYNPRSAVTRNDEYRVTRVKKGATLGANSTIVCGVTVGEFAFVAAGAVINRDVKPYALMACLPGRSAGLASTGNDSTCRSRARQQSSVRSPARLTI